METKNLETVLLFSKHGRRIDGRSVSFHGWNCFVLYTFLPSQRPEEGVWVEGLGTLMVLDHLSVVSFLFPIMRR